MKTLLRVKSILFFVFAIVLFFIHNHFVTYLGTYIPIVMIVYGLFEILVAVLHEKKFYDHHLFYFGCIELLLGIVLLLFIDDYNDTCVIWALWSILRESLEIEEIVERFKEGIPALISVVESIVIIVFSVLMMIEPGEHHAHAHTYLLSAELFVTALIPLSDPYLKKKIKRRKEKKNA